ncbi:MAG TPA: hypothetical protein VFG10_03385 [Saprospiraceae bacterium]|nr:hypothetical protein [Saprospiraceae bacterium]
MNSPVYFITSLITMSCINSAYTQIDSFHSTTQVIQHMTDAVETYDSFQYSTQMRFKESGGDTFTIRNFIINYKSNSANGLYGYDWKISEEVDSGYTFAIMALPEALFGIFSGNKGIGYQHLPKTLDLSSYTEYLRGYLFLSEVITTFNVVSPGDIMLRDSGEYYYLTRQMNKLATRRLTIRKDSLICLFSL